MISVVLNIITILLVSFLFYLTFVIYNYQKGTDNVTPLEVYKSLIGDSTVASVTRALTRPSVGDVGTFVGYSDEAEWADQPAPISQTGTADYVGMLKEGRPSVIGFM
jgi:hypothetical protein